MNKPKLPQITIISDVLNFYLFHHVEENCMAYDRQKHACKALEIELGSLTPRQLTADVIRRYKTNRTEGTTNGHSVCDSTIRRELVVLISALNFCKKNLVLKDAIFPSISLPQGSPPKDLWLTEHELDSLIELAATLNGDRLSRIYRMIFIVAETAARKGVVQKLTWPQVNFDRGMIEFHKTGQNQKNKKHVPVPISDRLLPILIRAFNERKNGSEYVLDSPYSIQHHFDKLRALACEKLGNKFEKVTLHTLRHTWATLAAQSGKVDLRQISGVLGSKQATVDRVYAHHCPEYLKSIINHRSKNT